MEVTGYALRRLQWIVWDVAPQQCPLEQSARVRMLTLATNPLFMMTLFFSSFHSFAPTAHTLAIRVHTGIPNQIFGCASFSNYCTWLDRAFQHTRSNSACFHPFDEKILLLAGRITGTR